MTSREKLITEILPKFHELWSKFKKDNNLSQNEEFFVFSQYMADRASVQVSLDVCKSWQLTDKEVEQLNK